MTTHNRTPETGRATAAQLALAERVARFGSWRMAFDGGGLSWSPGLYAICGMEPDSIPPDNDLLMAAILPQDRKTVLDTVERGVAAKSPFFYRCRAITPDGAEHVFDNHGDVELAADGTVRAIICVVHDVTDQVAAEERLRQSERDYRLLAEHATDMITRHAPDGSYIFISPAAAQLFGAGPRELARKHPLDVVVAEDRTTIERAIADLNAGAEAATFTYRALRKDGRIAWLETRARAVRGDAKHGPLVEIVAVTRDATARVQAEEAVRASEANLRFLAEHASDLISRHDREGRFLHVTPALERMFGYAEHEFLGRAHLDKVHPDDAGATARAFMRAFEGAPERFRYRVRHKRGHWVWAEAIGLGVADPGTGEINQAVCVTRDVTDQKRAEDALREASERAEAAARTKARFLANMSHELRTPLNAILGFTEVMQNELYGPLGHPRYKEYAQLVNESGALLLDLISDILDTSKIEAGKYELRVEPLDPGEVLRSCLRLVQQRAADAGVRLTSALPECGGALTADARALKQITLNLLSNALKFTPRGGTVQARARFEGGVFELQIADTGVGIAADQLPKLGQPFVQAANDPAIAGAGTGLGLALVRGLAELHGGGMTIASTEGEGTTVTVRLPRRSAQMQAIAESGA